MPPTATPSLTLADVLAARERLAGAIVRTPCARSEHISHITGLNVFLKLENQQLTGSFKERGALNRLATLTPDEAARGVVAASAGNHAQGVAYHATRRGIRSVIVMPLTTPLVKVQATKGFGAEVILHGANYDEACTEATHLCHEHGMTFIHPFDDPIVMAGQGTIGLELLDQVPGLEAVVVPIGGGGLIGGIACALKESRPPSAQPIRVIGVQTSRLPSMQRALREHHPDLEAARLAYALFAAGLLILYAGLKERSTTTPNVAQTGPPPRTPIAAYERTLSRSGDNVTFPQAGWMGAIQGLCLPFRGFSRSGATISTGLLTREPGRRWPRLRRRSST